MFQSNLEKSREYQPKLIIFNQHLDVLTTILNHQELSEFSGKGLLSVSIRLN